MSPQYRRHPARLRVRGVSMVEFTIVFPIAVLFVMGLIQTGFIYMAKNTVNHATFLAARAGSMHNASEKVMTNELVRALTPFYQDSTNANDMTRIGKAYMLAVAEQKVAPWGVKLERLSPDANTFKDFGVKDPVSKVTYIPNDNLEWRSLGVGGSSKVNIRDANLLKIRVVYGYELKIPLMAGVVKRIMCSGSSAIKAFGDVSVIDSAYALSKPELCLRYYMNGRIPIESFAIVEMQSRAEKS